MTPGLAALDSARERVRHAPLARHALALLVVLLVLLPIVGVSASYSADEGAAIIQARSLAAGDGWVIPHPLPEVDPDENLYPLELSSAGPKGVAAYAKHPLYPLMLAAADRAGGHSAMVVLSLFGTWVAALGAAALAWLLLGSHARLSLWSVGAGSPMLFNSYWVIAHSLAAAAVAWAAVALVRGAQRQAPFWVHLVPAPLLALATLLRTEAILFAAALAVVGVVVGVHGRRLAIVMMSGSVATCAAGAYLLDRAWERWIVGGPAQGTPSFDARPRSGGLDGRLDGFVASWLRPGPPGGWTLSAAAVVVAVVLIAAAVLALRRSDARAGVALSVGAAVLLSVRALALAPAPVPGLVMAFPVLIAATVGARRSAALDRVEVRLILSMVILGWIGVILTQYPEGGVAEWGGRYSAVALPLAAPLVIWSIAALLAHVPRQAGQVVTSALVVSTLALSVLSVRELRRVHSHTDGLLESIASLAASAGPRPVVVTDAAALPRLDWGRFDEHAWLLARPMDNSDLPGRLAELGHDRWVLVTSDSDGALAAYSSVRVIDRASEDILLVEHVAP